MTALVTRPSARRTDVTRGHAETIAPTSGAAAGPLDETRRVLIVGVANPASAAVIATVRERASTGPARFHLLLPDPSEHAEVTDGQRRGNHARGEAILQHALPLLAEAATSAVAGSVSARHDPIDAIEDMLRSEHVDEIILSTSPHHLSEGLHLDLPRRVAHLGLPVTTVAAGERTAAVI